jgi:EAL and modified HD-GYP domain-containing signal transduction protein
VSSRPAGKVFVARQPILDRSGRVFGYELLHRSDAQSDQFKSESVEHATAHILTDGLLAIGLDALSSGRHAFINVNRQFLLDGIPAVLPPGRVAFELGADVSGDDPDVLAVCQSLRQIGYALAIDHGGAVASPLMSLATFIKVDFGAETTTAERWKAFPDGPPSHAACIATHVETAEQLALAIAEGCTYFQGFYFGRPVIKEGSSVPPQKIAQLRLLTVLHDPDLTVMRLEEIIKPDPSMCYRVLRAVNSAGAALQTTVHSIREALVLLGCDTVRRWASLWALADAGQDAHAELVSMATVRARCRRLPDRHVLAARRHPRPLDARRGQRAAAARKRRGCAAGRAERTAPSARRRCRLRIRRVGSGVSAGPIRRRRARRARLRLRRCAAVGV